MKIKQLLDKIPYWPLLVILILVGAFLRLYQLEPFAVFLADQGRDAIIIKRIATGEHLTAIGPPTSIGQVFLGPFYYYLMAPWLWLFRFEPVGLAFGVSIMAIVYLIANYFLVKELVDKKTAIISTFLITFSATLIDFSRFSWNPNPLPFFSLLTVYFLIKTNNTHRLIYYALFGICLSFAIQLHYLALFLIPPAAVYFVYYLFKDKKNIFNQIKGIILSVITFIMASLPLIIFDLRHNLINLSSFLKLIKSGDQIATTRTNNLIDTFNHLNKYSFGSDFVGIINLIVLIILFVTLFVSVRKNNHMKMVFLFFIIGLIGVSLYPGPKHPHYFGFLYPFYYVIIAYFLSAITSFKPLWLVTLVLLIGYFKFNLTQYYFLKKPPDGQITHAKKISAFLDKIIDKRPFNFAVQPDGWQEDSYLYFLELKGKRPVDRNTHQVTEQMFVVCGNPCNLNTTRSWNITMFGKFKINGEWTIEGIKIYKLIH